jgi:hypothetical protein
LGISVLWPNQLLVNAKDDLTDSRILENTSFTKQPNMPNIPHSLFNVVWWHSNAKYIPNVSWLNPMSDDCNMSHCLSVPLWYLRVICPSNWFN